MRQHTLFHELQGRFSPHWGRGAKGRAVRLRKNLVTRYVQRHQFHASMEKDIDEIFFQSLHFRCVYPPRHGETRLGTSSPGGVLYYQPCDNMIQYDYQTGTTTVYSWLKWRHSRRTCKDRLDIHMEDMKTHTQIITFPPRA